MVNVDEIYEINKKINSLKKELDEAKKELKSQGIGDYVGNKYVACVKDRVRESFNTDKCVEIIKENNLNWLLKETVDEEKLENDIVKLNLQIDKLINSIAESNEFTLKYINKKIEEIEIEKQNKLKEISSLNLSNNNNDELLDYIEAINEKLNSNDFNELKILRKALIEKIVVTDKNIDIHYKI